MLGAIIRRAVVAAPVAYLMALIIERFLGILLGVAKAAPESGFKSQLVGGLSAWHSNFLLLALVGIIVGLLAAGYVEGSLGGISG